jgi:hypothetical protein
MLLDPLARQILNLSFSDSDIDQRSNPRTVVLVTPTSFSLRTEFMVSLIESLATASRSASVTLRNRLLEHGVEMDYFCQSEGWFAASTTGRSRRRSRQLQRFLDLHPNDDLQCRVRWTAILGRCRSTGPLVIGCCDTRQTLPEFAVPIELSGTRVAA